MSKVNKVQVALLTKIDKAIIALLASEKVTKSELSVVSRDLLEYLVMNGSTDIGAVNRLMAVLTPMNRRTSVLFFGHFLPWKYDVETESFTSMVKGDKKLAKAFEKVKSFLSEKTNDIWTWAEANIQIEAKPKNYTALLTALVSKAMADEQKNESIALSAAEVLKAVMVGGISSDELMAMVDEVTTTPTDDTPSAEVIALPDRSGEALPN